jgi:hypothetical protein
MDLRAIAAAATPTSTSTASTTTSTTDAAATTETTAKTDTTKKSFAALLNEAKNDLKSGEKLTEVTGHAFARIKGGERDAQCVNLSGNARNGEVFDLIWRNGHTYHVYGGKGADHAVIDMGASKKSTTSAKTDTSSTGGTTAA